MEIIADFLYVLGYSIDIVDGKGPCLSTLSFLTFPGCIRAILPLLHLFIHKHDLLPQLLMTLSKLLFKVDQVLIF